jgi:hypothetical protein
MDLNAFGRRWRPILGISYFAVSLYLTVVAVITRESLLVIAVVSFATVLFGLWGWSSIKVARNPQKLHRDLPPASAYLPEHSTPPFRRRK